MYGNTSGLITATDYEAFIALAEPALADVWADLRHQRAFDSPTQVGRRLIGAGYRATFGWCITPAYFPMPDPQTFIMGCSCRQGAECATPGKHPTVKHGQDVLPAAPSLGQLAMLLLTVKHTACNLDVLTGQRSQNLIVADVDPRHAGRLDALWQAGWPRNTPMELTGGGGWHVFARWPFAGPVPTDPDYQTGIEIKGDGALVIIAPSVHASGRHYAWLQGAAPWQVELATLPEAVAEDIATHAPAHVARIATRDSAGSAGFDVGLTTQEANAFAARRYYRALEKAIGEGEGRNNTAYWLARQLQALGLSKVDMGAWVRAFGKQVSDR